MARSFVYPLGATSSTLSATTSQPRSLLSIARLNIPRSRIRPSNCSLVRIDQTCLGRKGGFAPVSFPLLHGTCSCVAATGLWNHAWSCSSGNEEDHLAPSHPKTLCPASHRMSALRGKTDIVISGRPISDVARCSFGSEPTDRLSVLGLNCRIIYSTCAPQRFKASLRSAKKSCR
jgi:hypothetical protein